MCLSSGQRNVGESKLFPFQSWPPETAWDIFHLRLIASTLPKEKNAIKESKSLKDVKVQDEAQFMNDCGTKCPCPPKV